MLCDEPLSAYGILKPGPPVSMLQTHTYKQTQALACPFQLQLQARRNILLVSLSLPILTDMKGAACAGYHGNRCTLHLMGVAVGIRCRIVFPEPWLDAIASFNGMLSILLSLPSSLKTPYSLCGVTTLSCQNSPFLQDGSKA